MDATIISRFTSAIIDKITELIGIHDTSGTAHSNIRNSIPEANTLASNIQMDGTASAGTGTDYARANHVHPTDTTKVDVENVITNWEQTPSDDNIPSEKLVKNNLDDIYSQLTTINADISDIHTDLSEIELIDSTHSLASTSNWTGTSTRLTSLTKGTRILYRITYVPTARGQGASLNIQFTDNTWSGSKSIIFSNGTSTYGKWFASSIAKNDVLLLEYDGAKWVLLDFFAIGERPNVARTGSYNDLSDKPSYTPTITSSDTGAYKIGSINISGSKVDIYGKDTTSSGGTSTSTVDSVTDGDMNAVTSNAVYDYVNTTVGAAITYINQ